jgi:hypothetical protein
MDFVKWAIILSVFFLIVPVICIIIYVATPLLISLLVGANGEDVCSYSGTGAPGGSSNLQASLSNLCNTARSFLGVTAMLMIVLASPLLFLSNAIVSFEIFSSKSKGDSKVIWLAILWALPIIGGLAYLFKGRKNFKQG